MVQQIQHHRNTERMKVINNEKPSVGAMRQSLPETRGYAKTTTDANEADDMGLEEKMVSAFTSQTSNFKKDGGTKGQFLKGLKGYGLLEKLGIDA